MGGEQGSGRGRRRAVVAKIQQKWAFIRVVLGRTVRARPPQHPSRRAAWWDTANLTRQVSTHSRTLHPRVVRAEIHPCRPLAEPSPVLSRNPSVRGSAVVLKTVRN